jgi:hypothetical protein
MIWFMLSWTGLTALYSCNKPLSLDIQLTIRKVADRGEDILKIDISLLIVFIVFGLETRSCYASNSCLPPVSTQQLQPWLRALEPDAHTVLSLSGDRLSQSPHKSPDSRLVVFFLLLARFAVALPGHQPCFVRGYALKLRPPHRLRAHRRLRHRSIRSLLFDCARKMCGLPLENSCSSLYPLRCC